MLHDIGILHTKSPGLGCHGKYPYICHGFLGRELLDRIGLPEYGLISERHVGVGISSDDIRTFTLPLPERDMVPVSIEEQIICYADKFFFPYNPKTGSFSCSDLFAVKFQLPSLFLQGIRQV
jgi:uncharacterized protein